MGVYGEPMFDYIGKHPDLAPVFDAGMTAFHGHETNAMLEAYDFSEVGTLADIGGGNGSLLTAVLRRYPQLRGILFDLGHVIGRLDRRAVHSDTAKLPQGNSGAWPGSAGRIRRTRRQPGITRQGRRHDHAHQRSNHADLRPLA